MNLASEQTTYALVTVTPAASEPLTLQEAKDHLRVDGTDEDAAISSYLLAAREFAETATRRQFVTATLKLALDAFPSHAIEPRAWDSHAIGLPRPPLQSVTSITYVDPDGVTRTLATSEYQVDTLREPGRILPAYGKCWPWTRCGQVNAVLVTYVAGYALADVPATAKHLIKLLLSHSYENREPIAVGTIANELPFAAQSLIWQLRWGGLP